MDVTILLSSQGKNKELADKIKSTIESQSLSVEIIDLIDLDLPLYSTKRESKGFPKQLGELYERIDKSKSLVVISSEYNGGMTPSLTNTIAWLSRFGKDWRTVFNNKPTLIATFSGGHGQNVINGLRLQLPYIGLKIIGRSISASFSKAIDENEINDCVERLKSQIK